jgi:hypothetical protein
MDSLPKWCPDAPEQCFRPFDARCCTSVLIPYNLSNVNQPLTRCTSPHRRLSAAMHVCRNFLQCSSACTVLDVQCSTVTWALSMCPICLA